MGTEDWQSRRLRRVKGWRSQRRRWWGSGALRLAAAALTLAASGMLAYPDATDWYGGHLQGTLTQRLAEPAARVAYQRRDLPAGASLTRIRIPRIGLDTVVVEGTSPAALRAGAGHYPGTPLPGEPGNVGIAGHRTTYGAPFRDLDRMQPGDDVILDSPVGRFTYRVTRAPFVIDRADWSVITPEQGHVLTLTTCHPKRSDRQRLVVRAELASTRPVGG